jgi:TonB family protein
MNKSNVVLHPNGLQRVGVRIFQTAALALMVAMAIPACAADSRAVKSRIAPVYPEIAKRMRIAGEVRLQVTVDPDGKVTDVKKISGNTLLLTAAEDAVRKWRFESGSETSTVEVSLNFAAAQ